ncbi:hypothetical protein IAR55_002704 [Kwoniella newhampshirensis]|uniref:Pentatricopeptide repeat domain-containing protein n=1 Tax=Kwoniella newhampshirensis TaxID=1651941 RepID=A0AAW0Z014_9TREE
MLPSARQACARHLASSVTPPCFSQALPAESSRQALLRATSANRPSRQIHSKSASTSSWRDGKEQSQSLSKGRRGRGISSSSGVTYSAAVALAVEDRHHSHDPSASYTPSHEPYRLHDTHADGESRIPPEPEPPDDDGVPQSLETQKALSKRTLDSWLHTYDLSSLPPSPLPPLETFRGLVPSQPLLALLILPNLSQADLASIRHHEIRSIVCGAATVVRESPAVVLRLDPQKSAKALRVVRAITFALPSEKYARDAFTGKYLNGKLLRHLLYLCDRLGVPRLAKSIYQERLQEQVATDASPPVLQFDNIARDLSSLRQWKTLIEFFSLETFPHRYYTPEVIAIYMQAHFGIHQGSKVPRLFELYDMLNLKPTPEAYNHLIQAFLENGDLPAARAVVQEAKVNGTIDYANQQMAILRGYRALGLDVDLERRVLEDIDRLGVPLQARLLNALIRLRMDAGDLKGAESLMDRFNLEEWNDNDEQTEGNRAGRVKPTAKTAKLIFSLSAKIGDLDRIKVVWNKLHERPEMIDDEVIATLVEAMVAMNLLQEACDLLLSTACLGEEPSVPSEWNLPPRVKPGNRSLNRMLGEMSRQQGLTGLEKAMELMHSCGVTPDSLALKIIVDFARTNLRHSPQDLATLVSQLLDVSPDRRSTQSLLDTVLADAVVASSKAYTSKSSPRELVRSYSEDTFHPTAGLVVAPGFRIKVGRMVQSLESADSRSTSRSLANRLRFDALTSTEINGKPSARVVWNALIARGFKPDQRHVVALMQGYADTGHMYYARSLLALAQQIGVPISRSMLSVLLVGWGKKKRTMHVERAYEQIRRSEEGLDLRTVTAMIQALTYAGRYKEAKRLCYTDLANLDVGLDRKALIVATQALRASGDLKGALDLMKRHDEAGLTSVGRKVVRGIKGYARKKSTAPETEVELVDVSPKEGGGKAISVVELADQMLKMDDKIRTHDKKRWEFLGRGTRRRLVEAWKGVSVRGGVGARQSGGRVAKRGGVARGGQRIGRTAVQARRARRRELGLAQSIVRSTIEIT